MDATGWDHIHDDPFGPMPETLPLAQAEIRRLRAELLRVEDVLREGVASKSWTTLLAAATRAREMASRALARRVR